MTDIIPADVNLAARRGFIRTATQSLASLIPLTAITVPLTSSALVGVGLAVVGAVVTAGAAGLASYLSIISKGIPEDYQPTEINH